MTNKDTKDTFDLHALLKDSHRSFAHALPAMKEFMDQALSEKAPLLHDVISHIGLGQGKGLRPLLVLLCGQLTSCNESHLWPFAASIEMIHTATLLHDDIIDDSPTRRGQASAHRIWGSHASLLSGDFLFAKAFQTMLKTTFWHAMKAVACATAHLVEGEGIQLAQRVSFQTSWEAYRAIIERKTASLFQAACQVPALMTEGDPQQVKALQDFGYHFGILFQMRDDILDYTGDPATHTPPKKHDLQEGQITLPTLWLYEHSSPQEQAFLKQAFTDKKDPEGAWDHIQSLFKKYHVMEAMHHLMIHEQDQALHAISLFPQTATRQRLEEITKALVITRLNLDS